MAGEFNWRTLWRTALLQGCPFISSCNEEHGTKEEHIIEQCTRLALWKDGRLQRSLETLICSTAVRRKSDEKAEQLRLEGNKFFQKKLYQKAVRYYSKAILYASETTGCNQATSQLSLAFANRSAALYYIHKWKLAVDDVDRALKYGYPLQQKYKILIRKGECLRNQGCMQDATIALKLALDSLSESTLTTAEIKVKSEKIANLLRSCSSESVREEKATASSCGFDPHPSIANASRQISLQYSTEKGRYLVAETVIQAGDVIISEKPFAVVLLPDHYDTHCHYCCDRALAPVMCSHCIHVQYCSEVCKDAAWEDYHEVECPMWEVLQEVTNRVSVEKTHFIWASCQNDKLQQK